MASIILLFFYFFLKKLTYFSMLLDFFNYCTQVNYNSDLSNAARHCPPMARTLLRSIRRQRSKPKRNSPNVPLRLSFVINASCSAIVGSLLNHVIHHPLGTTTVSPAVAVNAITPG